MAILVAALAAVFAGAVFGVLALTAGLAGTGFLVDGFTALAAADFVLFAAGVVFAGFFIAFAMEINTDTGLLSLREKCTHIEPINYVPFTGLGFARAIFLNISVCPDGIQFAKRITLRP